MAETQRKYGSGMVAAALITDAQADRQTHGITVTARVGARTAAEQQRRCVATKNEETPFLEVGGSKHIQMRC